AAGRVAVGVNPASRELARYRAVRSGGPRLGRPSAIASSWRGSVTTAASRRAPAAVAWMMCSCRRPPPRFRWLVAGPSWGSSADFSDGVCDGGGAVVVRGEAGIGKSALLSEAGRLAAAQGLRVLTTTGGQSEAEIAFAGLYQLLRPVLDQVDRLPQPQRGAVLAAFGRTD